MYTIKNQKLKFYTTLSQFRASHERLVIIKITFTFSLKDIQKKIANFVSIVYASLREPVQILKEVRIVLNAT